MNIQIKHLGFDIPDDLKATITAKLGRLERLVPRASYIEVELFSPGVHHSGRKEAEVVVDVPGERLLRVREADQTLVAAVDRVVDSLKDALLNRKDKLGDHHYKGAPPKEWSAD